METELVSSLVPAGGGGRKVPSPVWKMSEDPTSAFHPTLVPADEKAVLLNVAEAWFVTRTPGDEPYL